MNISGYRFIAVLLALGSLFLLAAMEPPRTARPGPDALRQKTVARDPDCVIVSGKSLRDLLGKEVDGLRLYAYRQGRFDPIPYQIDERHQDGQLVCPSGNEPETDDDNGLFDENDEAVFMASDTGYKVPAEAWPLDWKAAEEIEIYDPLDQAMGWCYIVSTEEPGERSGIDYINYHPDQDKYVALYNTAVFMRDGIHRADYNANICPPEAGGTGVDITDRLKIRIEIRLKFPPVTLRFDEDDTEVATVAYIDGPIRVVRRNQVYLQVPFFSIPFGGAHDVVIYRDTNEAPVEVSIPKGAAWLIKSMNIRFGTDFSPAAMGMLWYNTYNTEGAIIDGRMSPAEKQLDMRLDERGRQEYWQLVVGPQGSMMRRGHYTPDLDNVLQTSIRYVDNMTSPDPPEEYAGQIGQTIFSLTLNLPTAGEYVFNQQCYYPHHFYPLNMEGISRYMNIRNRPLVVRTKHERGKTTAMIQKPGQGKCSP